MRPHRKDQRLLLDESRIFNVRGSEKLWERIRSYPCPWPTADRCRPPGSRTISSTRTPCWWLSQRTCYDRATYQFPRCHLVVGRGAAKDLSTGPGARSSRNIHAAVLDFSSHSPVADHLPETRAGYGCRGAASFPVLAEFLKRFFEVRRDDELPLPSTRFGYSREQGGRGCGGQAAAITDRGSRGFADLRHGEAAADFGALEYPEPRCDGGRLPSGLSEGWSRGNGSGLRV